jgi:hypothetical protein
VTTRKHYVVWKPLGIAFVVTLSACTHTLEPGEALVDCGAQNRLRVKQVYVPSTRPGVALVDVETSDQYENTANVQIALRAPKGAFYVDKLPRNYGITNSRGQLRVEWHAPDDGSGTTGEPVVVNFQAVDYPGDCNVDLEVTPKR